MTLADRIASVPGKRALSAAVLTCSLVVSTSAAAQAGPQLLRDPVPEPPPRDRLAVRIGFLTSGLVDSRQGKPFVYLDTGLRYKAGFVYFDLRLPILVAGFDFLFFTLQQGLGVNEPFNLFESLNEPIQYSAFLEPIHLRIGQTFELAAPASNPLRFTAGIFGIADFVFFDLTLGNQNPEEFEGPQDGVTDPLVVVPGGFVAISGDAPSSEWDFAVGVGPDVLTFPDFAATNGFAIYGDLEVQIDLLDDIGTYIRVRTSMYTHTQPVSWTWIGSYGVALGL